MKKRQTSLALIIVQSWLLQILPCHLEKKWAKNFEEDDDLHASRRDRENREEGCIKQVIDFLGPSARNNFRVEISQQDHQLTSLRSSSQW